ncbi:hypothetical protein SAMN02745121_00573 [Nannocystis exedens]|uniref:Uncharacterized protein n=1 Tax=Nannocystis exedens TaxID=54 RepID=A0A1I1TDR2_9BACT|nr:hypothetical protein [Nannocystis exedens]PCC66697.1 hypothetical protein NAEX_09290 [Nannocystis exedens]SFD55268.1 hypothetical protein SAMN02745121_00573 [Nannocystis exedens]
MIMRLAVPLALALACTPTSGPTRPAPSVPDARALPAGLSGVVEPWHPFDPQLAESAPVWLVTRYEPGTYPCRSGPDGSLEMLIQDRFTALQVVRGAVQAPGVDLNLNALRGSAYPRGYAEGRRYLLFLRPGPKGQALLADPHALGGMHDRWGPDEVLAVIDLDQSDAEAAAEQVQASRTGEFAGGRWDPAHWEALRAAATPEPARQRELAAFLQTTIARPRAPLAEVRAWLGPPDAQHLAADGSRSDDYFLARPAYAQPLPDGLYGHLELHYDASLQLRAVELGYLRWRVSPRLQLSTMLTAEEHAKLGLPRLEIEFR